MERIHPSDRIFAAGPHTAGTTEEPDGCICIDVLLLRRCDLADHSRRLGLLRASREPNSNCSLVARDEFDTRSAMGSFVVPPRRVEAVQGPAHPRAFGGTAAWHYRLRVAAYRSGNSLPRPSLGGSLADAADLWLSHSLSPPRNCSHPRLCSARANPLPGSSITSQIGKL